jgi:hypothetical protein
MPDFGRWTANGGDPSLNEINRTDRFIDALSAEQPVYSTDAGEAELAGLLAGWRDEIRDAPLRTALTPRDAVIALDRAAASRHRRRLSFAVVGSVAAAVLCLGGFGAVIAGAGPGDPLYGLRTMLFGEQQQTREDPVMLASQQLAEVQQLIDQGQWDAAQEKLQTLTTTVATVNDVEQKQELVTQWQEMTVKVDSQDAAATIPPNVPPPVFPDVPVPVTVGPETTTSTTTPTSPSDTATSVTTSPSETTTTSPTTTTTTSPTATTSPTTTTTSPTTTTTTTTTPSVPVSPPVQLPQSVVSSVQKPPSTPIPTPPPNTPIPTPPPYTPIPTPPPYTPIPTPTPRPPVPLPAPISPPSVAVQEPATVPSVEPPVVEAPAPRSPVTTTIVIPEPEGPASG